MPKQRIVAAGMIHLISRDVAGTYVTFHSFILGT